MIRSTLMPHQLETTNFCRKRNFAGIFLEYGTGKTLCALALAEVLKWSKILIISTKTSIQGTWPTELKKHTNFGYVVMVGSARQKAKILAYGIDYADQYFHGNRPMIFLINYDGVRNLYNELISVKWDAVFLDESTKIKSPFTKRTKVLWALGRYIPRRFIMTGFPVTENYSDLYAQIKFLCDKNILGISYYEFINRYFAKLANNKLVVKKKLVAEMVEKISEFCIFKSNKMLDLPPKRYKVIDIEKTPAQVKALRQLDEEFRLVFGKVKIDTQYVFALIEKSLEVCDGFVQDTPPKDKHGRPTRKPKLEIINTNKDEALLETLEELDAYHNKVVIWCAFRFTILKLSRLLTRLKYNVLTLTGETVDANQVVQTFQHSKRHTILLATQRKAAESITLSACRFAIYYSNTWSGDARANSEARIRRKGSEGHASILYVDMITKSSIEGKVYRCLRQKQNLVADLKSFFMEDEKNAKSSGTAE